jgi:hypothetical protein
MTAQSIQRGHRQLWPWRLAFLLLVVLPFLPKISIYVVISLAKITSCHVGEGETCLAGPISVSRTIVAALGADWGSGAGFIVNILVTCIPVAWLAVCYLAVNQGWARTVSRILLALIATLIFAALPYFASLPAFGNFVAPDCQPYRGGFGVCELFDGNIGGAPHILMIQVWLGFIGVPIGLLAFLFYVVVILVKREAATAQ